MTNARQPGNKNSGTFLALIGLVVIAFGLLGLAALVMPQVLGLLLVVSGFLFFGVFHYLLWGWWFTADSQPDDDEEPD